MAFYKVNQASGFSESRHDRIWTLVHADKPSSNHVVGIWMAEVRSSHAMIVGLIGCQLLYGMPLQP